MSTDLENFKKSVAILQAQLDSAEQSKKAKDEVIVAISKERDEANEFTKRASTRNDELHREVKYLEQKLSIQKSLVKQLKEICMHKDLIIAEQNGYVKGLSAAKKAEIKEKNPTVAVDRETFEKLSKATLDYNEHSYTSVSSTYWLNIEDNQPSVTMQATPERARY